MNNDPADERARVRRDLGLTRELQQTRAILPDPARGGTRGYPVWYRMDAIAERQQGNHQSVRLSLSSYYRWLQELFPHRMTGNADRSSIVGVDSLLLAIFVTIHPTSTHKEQATFIYNEGGNLYDDSTIARRLKEMDITKKVSSTEAYQAFTQRNMLKAELFWRNGTTRERCPISLLVDWWCHRCPPSPEEHQQPEDPLLPW